MKKVEKITITLTIIGIVIATVAWLYPKPFESLNPSELSKEKTVSVDISSEGDNNTSSIYATPKDQSVNINAETKGNNSTKVIDLRTEK